jgi:hypothetical protein
MNPLPERLADLARAVLTPLDAPASYLHSRIIGPEEIAEADDVDEWVALDAAVARRIAEAGNAAGAEPRRNTIVLRVGPGDDALASAPRLAGLALEALVLGSDAHALADAALAVGRALDAGIPIRAVLAAGETGIDVYRAAAAARQVLGTRVPIRVRWDDGMDIKGAALALTFGADELAGPLAPAKTRWKLAQVGGPAEESHEPSPSHVEALVRAAGRYPVRRT